MFLMLFFFLFLVYFIISLIYGLSLGFYGSKLNNFFFFNKFLQIDNSSIKDMSYFFNEEEAIKAFIFFTNLFNAQNLKEISDLENSLKNSSIVLPEYLCYLNSFWFLPEFILFVTIIFLVLHYIFFIWEYKTVRFYLIFFVDNIITKVFFFLAFLLFFFSWYSFTMKTYVYYKSFLVLNFFVFSTKFVIILLCIFLLTFIKVWYLQNQKNIFEFYLLLLASIFFMFFLISSSNLFLSYICLEGVALQSYALAIFNFTTISIEVVLKYFLLGSLTSAIMLFGISLLYGICGTLNFWKLHYFFLQSSLLPIESFYLKIIVLFIFFGLFFKLGVFPLHTWVPSVYANSPNPVTVFFAVVIKFIFSIFILRLSYIFFIVFLKSFNFFLFIASIGSIILGALGAYKELKIKYFISYTSINQAGFVLLGLCCANIDGIIFSVYYLFIYIILMLGFLNFLFNIQQFYNQRSLIYFSDLKKYYKNNLIISFFFSFYILSFAGLPPFAGFFGKLHLFLILAESKLFFLLFLCLFINIISLYYYVKIIKITFFENLLTFDNKFINYRFANYTSLKLLFFLTSIFNIFFIFFLDNFESFITYYTLNMFFPL